MQSFTAVSRICLALGILGVPAQGFAMTSNGPAEIPPASYQGKQYVDSQGCAFVRAGYDGRVTWVPRVTRDRKHLCGFKPTFATPPQAKQAATRAEPAPTPSHAVTAAPQTRAPASATAQDRQTAEVAAPTARPMSRPQQKAGGLFEQLLAWLRPGSSRQTTRMAMTPHMAPVAGTGRITVISDSNGTCPNLAEIARAHAAAPPGFTVRCGPRAESAYPGYIVGTVPAGTVVKTPDGQTVTTRRPTRVRVAKGAEVNVGTVTNTRVPEGFKRINQENLNAKSGALSPGDQQRLKHVWTDEVPRRLVDSETGRDVTAHYGRATQNRSGDVAVSTKAYAPRAGETEKPQPTQTYRYVQIGTFGEVANADRAKATLRKMGLPVSIAKATRAGKPLSVVLAGPFDTQTDVMDARDRTRKAGYWDAFARR
ncbi:SPOR domain-containing protein [Aliiroseovarius sp. PTFE2010]|uniref:SPOR domain-containing protein n=1 Tax=Aliiroseovarius sp. PTFE2010 TaxID=3417190 RepID=UPI003CF8FE17